MIIACINNNYNSPNVLVFMSVLCTQLFGPSVKRLCASNTFVCGFIVERTGRGEGVGSAKQSLKPPEVYGENMTAYKKHTQKTATRFAPTGFSLTPAFCVSVCLFVCLCLWLLFLKVRPKGKYAARRVSTQGNNNNNNNNSYIALYPVKNKKKIKKKGGGGGISRRCTLLT